MTPFSHQLVAFVVDSGIAIICWKSPSPFRRGLARIAASLCFLMVFCQLVAHALGAR